MITPEGNFIKTDDFNEMAKNAEIVEVICPTCKEMTRSEDLGDSYWLCYECGIVYSCDPFEEKVIATLSPTELWLNSVSWPHRLLFWIKLTLLIIWGKEHL